jgi:5-methyltetrahydrofolate--homocysteine methyltransferase
MEFGPRFQNIADHIQSGQSHGIQTLVGEAVGARPARAVWRETVLPSARDAIERYANGEFILPRLLRSLEVVNLARQALGTVAVESRGTIVVATLPGDVHHIGRALLCTVLSSAGYTVHDLGEQPPIETIIDTAVQMRADAIGLSALLVTSSHNMPRCIQALDARALDIPVLIGGAAINRAFGRRSAILPDGRIYAPGVFYCRDVFEGLATMDALVDLVQRQTLIERVRAEIEAERHQAPVVARARPSSPAALRHTAVSAPPYWGTGRRTADLREVWRNLDRNTLFRFHWGGYRASDATYPALVHDLFEPGLAQLTDAAIREGWLEARVVIGYFPCNADGETLVVFDPDSPAAELARLEFPRQSDGEQLCLADYFRPIASGLRDVVALQAVTVGPRAGQEVERLLQDGQYERMLLVNGLASATAEALAEHAHRLALADLHLPDHQGLRFSWGYQACPDLAEQRKVLALLRADAEIGLQLTESDTLAPEHSTVAIIVHHHEAKYFAVR